MSHTLAHRGPDGEGVWADGNVGLAHRRLAIIDPRRSRPDDKIRRRFRVDHV